MVRPFHASVPGTKLQSDTFLFLVSHRGFYSAVKLKDYVKTLLKEHSKRSEEPDLRQWEEGLPRAVLEALDSYVRQNNGLKMRYADPSTNAIRVYRMKGVTRDAKTAW